MDTPTDEQIAKLPRWAGAYIQSLRRERDAAVTVLNEVTDKDTPSNFYFESHASTDEQAGPTHRKHYIQARAICCDFDGMFVRVFASGQLFGSQRPGIEISWSDSQRTVGHIAAIPESFQAIRLLRKEQLR